MSTLKPITDGLWHALHDNWMPGGGLCFTSRMTVARLDGGGLMLHSPVPIDDAMAAQIGELGQVAHLVAPSMLHDLHVAAAMERYPEATVWAPGALKARREDLANARDLDADFPDAALQSVPLPSGPRMHETVFVHRPSRTLIVADVVLNIVEPKGWMMGPVLSMVGCKGRLRASRMLKWVFVKPLAPFGAAARDLADLDWDRLVVGHGPHVESGGKEALREGIAWLP